MHFALILGRLAGAALKLAADLRLQHSRLIHGSVEPLANLLTFNGFDGARCFCNLLYVMKKIAKNMQNRLDKLLWCFKLVCERCL